MVSFSAMPDANAVFAGWSGPCQGTGTCQLTVNGASTLGARFDCASPLVAAVLPGSRSVKTGTTATAFATIINSGANPTTSCSISLSTSLPASFLYQTTDPNTNALTRTPNTPVDIPARGFQTFLIALTANAAFAPTDAQFTFSCAGVPPARILSGLNTLLLSASTNLVADIVALAATSPDPSLIVDIPSANGTGAFAVATVNLGAAGPIVVSADTGGESLAVRLSICQTNPATAACLAPPSATVTTQINAEQTPTFSIFVAATGPVTFDPASNRVFVRFKEPGGATRGATSVAVRMQ